MTTTGEAGGEDRRGRIVVLAGSATTFVALSGVFAAAHAGENIMGWYADYILPVGALLVGMVAASGYGIAAWVTGLKMTPRLMWSVAGELALSYFIAQYGEYRHFFDDGSLAGFVRWFDAATRAFAWKDTVGGAPGEPLGVLGYGLRALELAGFIGGGALVPLGLRRKPYCDPCRTYKRTKVVAQFVDGDMQAGVAALFAAAERGDAAACAEVTKAGPPSRWVKKGVHARVSVVRCPRCADGSLVADWVSRRGNNVRVTRMGAVALPPERMRALFD